MDSSKYGNRRIQHKGETFDSQAELRRWLDLQLLERAGKIGGLMRQARFELAPAAIVAGKKKRALTYVADFLYIDSTGDTIVEDKKGALTEAYKIKRHLMKTVHNIDIKET